MPYFTFFYIFLILMGNPKTTIMKRVLIVFTFLIAVSSFSQEVKTQKDILSLPNTHLIKDFNLKIGSETIIPQYVNEKHYDQREKRGTNEITSKLVRSIYSTFNTETKNIKARNIIYNGKTTAYDYSYDDAGNIKMFRNRGNTISEKTNYDFYADNSFSYTTSYNGEATSPKITYTKTIFGYQTEGLSNQLIYLKNNLINKTITNYNKEEPSVSNYNYNEFGQLIRSESSFYTIQYNYNERQQLESSIETSKRTQKATKRYYVYAYDAYGNWIVSLSLSDSGSNIGITSFPTPKLREITYSNGEVTGTTDIEKVENELIALRAQIFELKKLSSTTTTATWLKPTAAEFIFKINNQGVLPKDYKFGFMGGDILLFHLNSRQLYVLKNFTTAQKNVTLDPIKIDFDTSFGYWYKAKNGAVHVFTKNGAYLKEYDVFKYAQNNNDVIFKGKNEAKQVVLKNYRNVEIEKVYPVDRFDTYQDAKIVNNTKPTGKCLKGDCINGYGEFEYPNGNKLEGFFKSGVPNGPMHNTPAGTKKSFFSIYRGAELNQEGFVYEYNGSNIMIFANPSKNAGFYNDYTSKKTYELVFNNGKITSKKELMSNNSTTCVVGNCTNGIGVYVYKSGATYMGTFRNGKREGFGTLYFKNGNQYIGEFYNNNYHGLGSYIWSEYNYYMGFYKNGKQEGEGVMYYNKESFKAGQWVNGQLRN